MSDGGTRRDSEEQLSFDDADARHCIAGGAAERASAVQCLTIAFYLCDLRASAPSAL
jgi:hypothetical protein